MKPIYTSLSEYIKSGDYFRDARIWYRHKYIYPFSQRSFVLLLSFIICALFLGLTLNIKGLFPYVTQVKYVITTNVPDGKDLKITHANQIKNEPSQSLLEIMLKNYVTTRESYRYEDLHQQFIFIKNNSTRIVFHSFYNFMNIDNSSSPLMLYQKTMHKYPKIISIEYTDTKRAIVKFNSIVENSIGEITQKSVWQATIDYEIDKIQADLPAGTRFNFTITNYQLKLLEGEKNN